MKKLFNTVTLFFLLSSCSAPYYQLIEIKSDVIKEDGSTAVASNNDLDIITANFTLYSIFFCKCYILSK